MLATYSGSKAFLATFSSALGEEVKQHGIVVENANTYFVVNRVVDLCCVLIDFLPGVKTVKNSQAQPIRSSARRLCSSGAI